jgi:hypothetical protein
MQTVSDAWKEQYQQRAMTNESFVRLILGITDPDANEDIGANADEGISYSEVLDPALTRNKIIPRFGTFEQNQWLLDGSVELSNTGDKGYISNALSGPDRTCNVTYNRVFSTVHDNPIPGITILWDDSLGGEFASDFTVTTYNGVAQTAQAVIVDNKDSETIVGLDISTYNRIVINVTKWCLPNRRIRINNIMMGLGWIFDKESLISYSHEMIVDTIGEELPKNEIVFEVDNQERVFDIVESSGLAKYLMARQSVDVEYGLQQDDGSIEWINGGVFYLNEWGAKYGSYSANFSARDKLVLLQYKFLADGADSNLLGKFNRVITASNLTEHEVSMDIGSVGAYSVGYFPQDTSIANCFQYLAQAACIAFWIDRNGVFRFEPLDDTVEDYAIGFDTMYDYPQVNKSASIREIVVKIYTWTSPTESTVADFVYPITDNIADRQLTIDNPLVVTNDHAVTIITHILAHQLDTFSVESTYRSDPRLDAGDMFMLNMNDQNFEIVARELTYGYNGAFRGVCKSGITNPIIAEQTNDIVFTPETMTLDLSQYIVTQSGNDTVHPTQTFTLHADYYPDNTPKYLTWSASATHISSSVGTVIADSISITPTANGKDITVTVTGNYLFNLTSGAGVACGFSSNVITLTAKSSDGYSESYSIQTSRVATNVTNVSASMSALNMNTFLRAAHPTISGGFAVTTTPANQPVRVEILGVTNIPNGAGTASSDTRSISGASNEGRNAILNLTGNYAFTANSLTFYGFSTNALTLRITAPNGYTKDYSVPFTRNTQSATVAFAPIGTLDFDAIATNTPATWVSLTTNPSVVGLPVRLSVQSITNMSEVSGTIGIDEITFHTTNTNSVDLRIRGGYKYISTYSMVYGTASREYYGWSSTKIVVKAILPNGNTATYSLPISNPKKTLVVDDNSPYVPNVVNSITGSHAVKFEPSFNVPTNSGSVPIVPSEASSLAGYSFINIRGGVSREKANASPYSCKLIIRRGQAMSANQNTNNWIFGYKGFIMAGLTGYKCPPTDIKFKILR